MSCHPPTRVHQWKLWSIATYSITGWHRADNIGIEPMSVQFCCFVPSLVTHTLLVIRSINSISLVLLTRYSISTLYKQTMRWTYSSVAALSHDDVINWKYFPHYRRFVRETTGHRWIPLTKACDADLWRFCDGRLNKRLSKQSRCRRFETPWCSLWRHCNADKDYGVTTFCYRLSWATENSHGATRFTASGY